MPAAEVLPADFASQEDAAASQQLAVAIGSRVQLRELELADLPRHLGPAHCCAHLTALVRLTGLTLNALAVPVPAEGSLIQHGAVQLLAGLIALQALEVKNMKLLEREAVALCATGLTHLTGLEKLDLRGNLLSSRSCAALATTARDLPALSSVHILDADE
jgi:hypothetical protein